MKNNTDNTSYINFDEYIRQGEPEKKKRADAWRVAIGLQAVDGLKTSAYLQELARRNIEGEITIDEVKTLIDQYYAEKKVGRVLPDLSIPTNAKPAPDKPRHPGQKYLLTAKGIRLYNNMLT